MQPLPNNEGGVSRVPRPVPGGAGDRQQHPASGQGQCGRDLRARRVPFLRGQHRYGRQSLPAGAATRARPQEGDGGLQARQITETEEAGG